MSDRLKRPPKDGLVRAHPCLELRATDPEEPGEVEDPNETPGQEAQEEAEERTLYGYFTRFDEPTEINSYYEGNFIERIAPGAFAKWFAEQRDSIRCLFQHGMDFQVGDKPLGPISELREDGDGAYYEVPLLDAHYVREVIPGLEAGLYGASFRFRVIREEWDEEPDPSDGNPKGLPERTLLELQVPEFGPVTFPAYPGATAAVRSMTDEYLARRFQLDPDGLEDVLKVAADPSGLAELFASRGVRSVPRIAPQRAADVETERQEPVPSERAGTQDGAGAPSERAAGGEPEAEGAEAPAEPGAPERAGDTQPDGQETRGADDEGVEPAAEAEQDPSTGADSRGGRRATPKAPATPAAADPTKENPMNIAELRARQEEIRTRLVAIDEEHRDAELPAEIQTEYDSLTEETRTVEASITTIEQRQEHVRGLAATPENRESGDGTAGFHTTPAAPTDPYDTEEIFSRARAATSMEARGAIMRDAALRAIDEEQVLFHERANVDEAKGHMEWLLRREARIGDVRSEIAERILHTGSELYQRSFLKVTAGAALSPEEQRALSTFTGSAGGFAVPYQLDPTLIPTSNASVNPFRAIARVITTLSNEWKGVTSGAITAAYAAEAAEASDNSPTLAQPVANPERAQAFVPFSYELEGDWSEALTEMAGLISEAKDDLEAIKFLEGAGHGSNEPEGLLTGATTVVKAGGTAAFAVADFYALEAALPPRFRNKAQYLANRAIYNKIRQFDTAGGAALWVWLREGLGNNGPTPGNIEAKLAGYPVNEVSSMKEVLTTGTKILTIGDFSKFLIVDRVGMDIQVIPNLFGSNGRPTGQRGLYAIWRNTSKVLAKAAFRTLETS